MAGNTGFNRSGVIFPVKRALIDFSAGGDSTIVAAVAGFKIKVIAGFFVCTAASNVQWWSGAAGTKLSGLMGFGANGGMVMPEVTGPDGHWLETAVNTALVLNSSAATQVGGEVLYVESA